MVCFTKLTPRTPPSVIHGWKATDLLYEMVRRKNYWRNPISRQNFANALAVNHNLKLEVCHRTFISFRFQILVSYHSWSINCSISEEKDKSTEAQPRCTCHSSESTLHGSIVAEKWEPSRFSGQIRKVEARLGKLAKIRKVKTD